jgi:hypothetical protein
MIDFIDKDRDIISKTENGIKWVRNVYNNGNEWKLFPPSRPELYPNLCIDSGKWNDYKKEIAYKLGDISLLWNCGVKHRDNAIKNGVASWRDVKCNSELLGLKGNIGKIVDRMITVNTQHTELIYPTTIKNKKLIRNQNELFVDFETISNIFDECKISPYKGQRFIDMFKNKIISDLSGVPFNPNLKWSEPKEFKSKDPEMDNKVIDADEVSKIGRSGKILRFGGLEEK